MKPVGIDLRSLPAQMILSFVALVLLTAAAAGLPAVWLIRNEFERQAWAQVDQGSRAAQALYAAQRNEMTNLALLTAQRPTLRDLLRESDQTSLVTYLETLQSGAGLDLLLICDANHQLIAQVGGPLSDSLCAETVSTGFYLTPLENSTNLGTDAAGFQVWLLAIHSVGDEAGNRHEQVIVGMALDDEFAARMQQQTGLEHTLRIAGRPVATSLPSSGLLSSVSTATFDEENRVTFELDERPYYGLRFPLPLPNEVDPALNLEAEVALEVTGIAATQRQLVWTLVGSIIAVALVGSVLGTFLARRIGRPLERLTKAATELSQGNLDSPIAINARVREVALVAQALEGARADLQRSLTALREEKAWTDHLLEAIVEGIVILDQHSRITFFSSGAERITGWQREDVMNRSCDEVFQPVEVEAPFSQVIPTPGRRHKITVELDGERQVTLAITGARLHPPEAGDDTWVALVFRDVSEEEAVHRLMGHFLANVAHEFRTPLSSLAASVELLLDQAPDLSAAELQELLTSLHLGILGLQKLVDNLLESASIEAGRFRVHPRPANLGEIIAKAIQMMQPLLDKHGQRLVLELPAKIPVVRADSRRTVQVLVNLLSNASKYGPDEAEITIGADLADGWVRVTVADRGPRIPVGYRKDLFRRFAYPTSENDKSQYGAGLGLSVVKAIIEAHGGQAGVEDRPGGGLIFWFTLPAERAR